MLIHLKKTYEGTFSPADPEAHYQTKWQERCDKSWIVNGLRHIDISTCTLKNSILIIDEDDWEYVKEFTWTPKSNKTSIYAVSNNKRRIYIHRQLIRARAGEYVDHIDGNGLNNSKRNLRICTNTQNQYNRKNGYGKSKYKGVMPIITKSMGIRYKSYITVSGRRISLGTYSKEIDAAKSYNDAAIRYFGKFARGNILT